MWKKWTRDYFPGLIVQSKWHVEWRNVKEGDEQRFSRWLEDRHGYWSPSQPRRVTVLYKNRCKEDTAKYTSSVERAVHRLIVSCSSWWWWLLILRSRTFRLCGVSRTVRTRSGHKLNYATSHVTSFFCTAICAWKFYILLKHINLNAIESSF